MKEIQTGTTYRMSPEELYIMKAYKYFWFIVI
jgi:hypothetical protein